MPLVTGKAYFISALDVVLRASADEHSDPVNHLLFGDWLRFLGEEQGDWARVKCRGDKGWLKKEWFSGKRVLEINFVDIGQGDGCHIVTPDDKVILLDAGEGDNMFRFLSWRYNLRDRKVAGVDGVADDDPEAQPPFDIDHVVISHPDSDHYYGFNPLFDSGKVRIKRIYHNGIAERPIRAVDKDPGLWYPSGYDLGGFLRTDDGDYLWETIDTDAEMHNLIQKHPDTGKWYLSTLRAARNSNASVKFIRLSRDRGFVPGFGAGQDLRLKLLGPITEKKTRNGTERDCLYKLGNEGETKNGHSVIIQLQIGKLKVMLGGDLNTQAEDYLFRHYGEATRDVSRLERDVYELQAQGSSISPAESQVLNQRLAELEAVVAKTRAHFQADVTKACHHGSHHFSEAFLRAINAAAVVVSSGDEENYSHPRPDALGSFGKYSRGIRPLIFSTELARSTREFTPVFKYYEQLKDYEARIEAAPTPERKDELRKEMQEKRDRNVAVYGMITLRTNGEKVLIAQKLEVSGGNDNKWDLHELEYNPNTDAFEYALH